MHKFIKYFILFFLVPLPTFSQTTFKNISDLSEIASKLNFSEKGILSGLLNDEGSGFHLQLAGYSSLILSSNNTAIIDQNGDNNIAQISQYGSSNTAVLEQVGNHITNIVTQIGNGNIYGSSITGDNHYLKVSQYGNNNLYILNYNVNEPLNNTILQTGYNLKAVQIGGGKPYQITQYGSGMNIIIRHFTW